MKILFSIVISVILISCGSMKRSVHTEEITVLEKHFSNLKKGEKLHKNTIRRISVPAENTLVEAIGFATLNNNIADNGQPNSIRFDTIFDFSDMAYIKEKFSTAEPIRLKQSWLPNIDLTKKSENTSGEIKFTTLPVLSPDGRFALFYAEDYFGGQIYVYKKNISSGDWEFFSTSSIWMS